MKYQISPLIRKIANIGTTIALIDNGTDPQMATRYGQLAEGFLTGVTLEGDKEDVMVRLQRAFIDSTFQILNYETDIEIEYEVAKGIANDLFNLENFYQYIQEIDCEALIINKFKKCCLKYDIPFIEQKLDVNYIVEKIVFKINNCIMNDIHFLLVVLLIVSNENRQDIIDIKEAKVDNYKTKHNSFKYNQKNQFIEKWENSLFLHKHIKLCDIYTQPNFSCKQYKTNEIEKLILNYLADSNKHVLFLFGNPGLGKSSLMSCFANMFKGIENYIFIKMHDLEPRIAKNSLIDAVLDFLECKRRDLENAVIFLDGYDELRVDSKHYELCLEFVTELKQIRAKVIISSRLNYIDLNKNEFNRDFSDSLVVELQPFNKQQMFEYIKKFEYISQTSIDKVKKSFNSKATEIEVYGIPFILYLICSLDIDINQMTDIQSIYDKVFAFDGGLYDKIYDEEAGHYLTQNPQCKRDLLNISMELAFKMFSTDKLFIENEIVDKEIISKYPQRKNTYALGNYYYIENNKLYFVHKTFQEYFACRYLLSELEQLLTKCINSQIKIEEAAKCFFKIFYCDNYLFKRIENIFFNMFQNSKLRKEEQYKTIFCKFVPYLYDLYINNMYTDVIPKNNILKSQNCLSSLHKIINFFGLHTFGELNQYKISLILRNKQYVIMSINNLILNNSDLSGAYLRGAFNQCKFYDVNFCRCDLHSSFINNTEITNCKLSMIYGENAYFNDTKLYGFKLSHSNMTNTKFNDTFFDESTIRDVDFSCSAFNQCTFKNTRFMNCDFSYARFNNIEGNIMFYECIFEESRFADIMENLYFNDCDGDYEILQSKNDVTGRYFNKIVDSEE